MMKDRDGNEREVTNIQAGKFHNIYFFFCYNLKLDFDFDFKHLFLLLLLLIIMFDSSKSSFTFYVLLLGTIGILSQPLSQEAELPTPEQ